MDVLAHPIISPLSCHPDSCGPPSTRPRWVSISITCWTALLPHLAKWLRALPGAGGAATTGKDVPVTLTLGTTVQSWRNSVSSAVSLILCLFVFNPLHILLPTVSASSFPFLVCGVPINNSDALAAHLATGEGLAGCFSPRAESRPTACGRASVHTLWQMMACSRVGENSDCWPGSPGSPLARSYRREGREQT